MAHTGTTVTDPTQKPRTVDHSVSLANLSVNPLPPPGRYIDGRADLHPVTYGNYPAQRHVVTVALGGTITAGETWTLTITPLTTGSGPAIAAGLSAITISADVPANPNDNATGLGDAFVTAIANSSTLSALSGIDSVTRLAEIVTVVNATGTLTLTGVVAGATFSVTATQEAGGTATINTATDAARANLRVGVFVATSGTYASDGVTPIIRPLQAGDSLSDVIGVVMDSNRLAPIDGEAGWEFHAYKPGRDVPIIPIDAEPLYTVYAEAAVDIGDTVHARATTSGSQVAGAANDDGAGTGQLLTATPTVANSTKYAGFVQIMDLETGNVVKTSYFDYDSDGSATDAEIVAGIQADLADLSAYSTVGGTTTLTLTQAAGYIATIQTTAAGVLVTVETTPPTTEHVRLPIKFRRSTTAAGIAAVSKG